jgi:hypothetical protein
MRVTPMSPYLALLRTGFTLPYLLPGKRCALTAPFHPYPFQGGIFSVALSVNSRRPGVTWRHTLWSPDFPPLGAIVRPTRRTVKSNYQRLASKISSEYLQKFELEDTPVKANASKLDKICRSRGHQTRSLFILGSANLIRGSFVSADSNPADITHFFLCR